MTDSWQLKLDRAQKHLDEFEGLIGPLLQRCVNPVSKGWETYDQQPAFVYRVRFSNPDPDERLSVIAGDIMHNVRSALDHSVVALAPHGREFNAAFPIFTCDIQARDETTGRYLHPADRKKWERRVRGLPEKAVTLLDFLQPYNGAERGEDPNDSPLALLNVFQNADKHRELSVIAQGLDDPAFFFTDPSGMVTKEETTNLEALGDDLMRNGAVVNLDRSNPPQKMEMEIEGTPRIVIGRSIDGPMRQCPDVLERMLRFAREIVADLSNTAWW